MREIYALEGVGESRTKSSTPFEIGGPFDGLHHKHFTSGSISMVTSNVLAANSRRTMRKLAGETFSDGFSVQSIATFARAIAVESYGRRAESIALTGESIVYAEHAGENITSAWRRIPGETMRCWDTYGMSQV